ncbi:flagellar basal-body MS-ring/collar protein FliF [Varunaivibrio sulfuroxidans]|uniref:Flagellar M-ring protein n=1 Tax=Varunaivibrio sulfuroxidans TaxID=1773489 RepID=A0A4R3JE29_9PROT|nr:flagellar basal-body MS-ring/collar protein FliF [Varunaivibrio sulfuroxidans]TCS63463.1 flagellar M-ring protein FliF [Varunaivibrio sulfuroxidans]WES30391.1 flagellar basal-body MS-ring/collar protein FliF [Varunaivibrio sulfuroxidans]
MDTLQQILRNLGPTRLIIMGGVLISLVAFFIYLTTRLTTPQMALLYADLSPNDSAQIVSQLESRGIPFETSNNGAKIMVPGDQALRLRMDMADRGLPSGGTVGYELFDHQSALGTTNFQQNVTLVRALEGELARTVQTIDIVKSARIHLVMPNRQLFSRQRQKPSASVILKMRGSNRLTREQVSSVQHLIAAAVPGLVPQSISVVDDKGSLLAPGFEGDPNSPDQIASRAEKRKLAYQNRMSQMIEQLVEKSIGFGKVRAEVTADMNFDRITTNEETYNPDGQVVRSTQTVDQTNSSQNRDPANVSVGQNLPDPNAANAAGTQQAAESRTEETVNYEISKKVVNHIQDTGVVKRLSVAVLVDGAWELDAKGKRVYRPRTKQELAQLATLVRGAIGYNAKRGDVVEVVNMKFAEGEPAPEVPLDLFFGLDRSSLLKIAEMLVLTIVAVLVILLVIRPLISRMFEALPAAAGALAEGGRMIADHTSAAAGALAGPPVPGGDMVEEDQYEELIDIDRVEGRVKASSVKKVGEIVDKHPEEALSIIRNWMYQET